MTYGWTILVILIAGAALVYFDVLNPSKFLPDNCNVQGFLCTDFKAGSGSGGTITLFLTNNVGDDIVMNSITVGGGTLNPGTTLRIGKSEKFDITPSPSLVEDDRFKGEIVITYTTLTSGISHTNKGEIATIVELT